MTGPLVHLSEIDEDQRATFGGKAVNLSRMFRAGLPVPEAWCVPASAFDSNGSLMNEAVEQLASIAETASRFAVRSSASVEDSSAESWAGQFETFLDVSDSDLVQNIEACRRTVAGRALAYGEQQRVDVPVAISVILQQMVDARYAGVLFTKNPMTGDAHPVTEYVEGLGEALVSGKVDPFRIVLNDDAGDRATPFDVCELRALASAVERLFGAPQDIEWAWADNTFWLLQSRNITTSAVDVQNYDLGAPESLFYWGPTAADAQYMSDFMAAIDLLFARMVSDDTLPTPPRTIVLFQEQQMVWLCNGADFARFCESTFDAYLAGGTMHKDRADWLAESRHIASCTICEPDRLVTAWLATELAEFSVYGAEASLTKTLQRFDEETRRRIWSVFTVPDHSSFMTRIDRELEQLKDASAMAEKYPWIMHGYQGIQSDALPYFTKRLEVLGEIEDITDRLPLEQRVSARAALAARLALTESELLALTAARELAEWMDDRKEWMFKTRHLLTQPIGSYGHGWYFDQGQTRSLDSGDAESLWERYVGFKDAQTAVSGIVACYGTHHFLFGEVVVVNSPSDTVPDGKILMVRHTDPGYVPLMRRAKALVTDHGGMMSHAAIVAREFNLPCIVSTRRGTKTLKTGDLVVLDLVKGDVIQRRD